MAKVAKVVFGLLILIVLLLVGAVVAITQWINPNDFKPQIESLAAQQGFPLDLKGDLSWQFFPSFGVSIGQTALFESAPPRHSTDNNNKTLASIEEALAKVAVIPLFKKQLVVETLYVDGFNANLVIDQSGSSNWESLGKIASEDTTTPTDAAPEEPETSTPPPSSQGEPLPLDIHVSKIQIRDGKLNFTNMSQQQTIKLSGIQFELTNVNVDENWFPLVFSVNANIKQGEQQFFVSSELQTQLKINNRFDALSMQSGEWKTKVAPSPSDINNGDIESITLTFAADVEQLTTNPKWQAQVELLTFNAKPLINALNIPLPEMKAPQALQKVGFSLKTQGTTDDLMLSPVQVLLDKTKIQIEASAKNMDTLSLKIAGDSLNLDDYLPPPTEDADATAENTDQSPENKTDTTAQSENAPQAEDPFAALRAFNADIDMAWQHLIANQLHFKNVALKANNNAGLAKIAQFSTDFYEGNIDLTGQLDARQANSRLRLSGDVSNIQLNPMLLDLIDNPALENFTLEGAAFSTLNVSSQGKTISQLIENLDATMKANTQALKLAPINIQRYVCQAVALLSNKKIPEFTWPQSTHLQDVKAVIRVQDQVAKLEKFNAGVENFLLGSLGEFNLDTQHFKFHFPFTLLKRDQQPQGCPTPNPNLINQSLSLLKCEGSVSTPTCKLDSVAIREQAKSLIAERAKEELKPHQEKLEKKLDEEKDKLKDKLKDRLGEDVTDKLKDIFKR